MSAPVLLDEINLPGLKPFTRFRSAFTLRDGIFTPAERLRLEGVTEVLYRNADPQKERVFAADLGWISFNDLPVSVKKAAETGTRILPPDPVTLPARIAENIEADLHLLPKGDFPDLTAESARTRFLGVHLVGDLKKFFINSEAIVLPGSVLNSETGPVILDAGCRVTPFTYIEGPFYGGKGAMLDNVRITGGTVIGNFCRVGGEIENSIINDFSNKHHEGFIGHSVLGSWVNIGALSTTSDLKNNYGEIRLIIEGEETATGTVKFGSLIGDHVKTAIGIMLNTGTVIDAGCNVFGGTPPKYMQPLSWGTEGLIYEKQKFLKDAEKIMARRKQSPGPYFSALLEMIAGKTAFRK